MSDVQEIKQEEVIETAVESAEEKVEVKETKSSKQKSKSHTGTITGAKNVRCRKAPSPSADIAGVLEEGTKVTILEKVPKFVKIQAESFKDPVYVMKDYVRED